MTVQVQWNGDAFLAQVERAAGVGVLFVGERLAQEIRSAFPRGGVNDDLVTGKTAKGRNLYRGSPVGGPPGTRSNRLRGSIAAQKAGPLSVQVGTNVEYARIHELGGTINHPGGTPYTFGSSGRIIFLSKRAGDALRASKMFVGYTRPHTINMPKRPFLVPGLNRYNASGKMTKDFDRSFKGQMRAWLKGGAA